MLLESAMDSAATGAQTQQGFQNAGGAAPGTRPGSVAGGGPAPAQAPQPGGLSALIQQKGGQAVNQALTPKVGPAMAGVPDPGMDQIANLQGMNMNMSQIPPELLQILRQRGAVL